MGYQSCLLSARLNMTQTIKPAKTDRQVHTLDKRNTAEGMEFDVFEKTQP